MQVRERIDICEKVYSEIAYEIRSEGDYCSLRLWVPI